VAQEQRQSKTEHGIPTEPYPILCVVAAVDGTRAVGMKVVLSLLTTVFLPLTTAGDDDAATGGECPGLLQR
jgi:hypothetical protein